VALAIGAFVSGCNAILGNDAHELAPRDGGATGTGGTASTGTTSTTSTSTTGPSTTSTATSTGTAGSGGGSGGSGTGGGSSDAGSDAPAPVCTPNAQQCQGRTLRQCSAAGQWMDIFQCPYACVGNVCAGTCVPGAAQCTLNVPQTCDDNGQWVSGAACPAICTLGQCTGMCVPNTVIQCGSAATCNQFATQTCDGTGTYGDCAPAPSNCLALPTGWQAVATTQGACPQGFGSPQSYYTKADGDPFTCQCGCGGTQKCGGTVTLNEFDPLGGANCTGTPTKRTLMGISSACGPGGGNVLTPNSYTISDIVYGPAPACTAAPKALTMPQVVTQSTTLCMANSTCPGGACLSLLEGRNLCLMHAGNVACPMDYPTATVMSPTYDDNRACGACTCGSTLGCTLNDVQLNNDSTNCTEGHPYWMNADTTCKAAPVSYPLNATKVHDTVTGNGTCAETAPSMPTGAVHLNIANTVTVCCR
jgi:hypothetical protein